MSIKTLSESDICAKYITSAFIKAGWDEALQIRREVFFTKGRIIIRGKLVTRGKAKRADYVLYYQHFPIALIEAKDNNHAVGDGMQQALDYAVTLDIPFVFSSNGDGFVFHDRTGQSTSMETALALQEFPGPAKLWTQYCTWKGLAPNRIRLSCNLIMTAAAAKSRATTSAMPSTPRLKPSHQRPEPNSAGHGDRHRQDLHGFSDYLATLEVRAEKAHSVFGGS